LSIHSIGESLYFVIIPSDTGRLVSSNECIVNLAVFCIHVNCGSHSNKSVNVLFKLIVSLFNIIILCVSINVFSVIAEIVEISDSCWML